MIKKSVQKEIDRVLKSIWLNEIQQDYMENCLLKEDSLKCAIYYHLRNELEEILKENDLRIYPEFYIPEVKYRADLAIVRIDPQKEETWLKDMVTDIAVIMELKYTSGTDDATINWVKNDLWKFKDYLYSAHLSECQFYFAALYESDCEWLNWLDARSTNRWAKGRVTELVSGFIGEDMCFEVHSYNGMNKSLNANK